LDPAEHLVNENLVADAPARRLDVVHRRKGERVIVEFGGDVEMAIQFLDAPRVPDDREADLMATAAALVAGQATLAPAISIDASMTAAAAKAVDDLATLLHGAHAYTQQVRWTAPQVTVGRGWPVAAADPCGEDQRAILLWSGGKDSLAALEVLRVNGFEVIGLHAEANPRVSVLELTAAERLADAHALPLKHLAVDWTAIDDMMRRNSSASHSFPLLNEIPHGRDLILAAAGAAMARMLGARFVTAGYERELWTTHVPYDGGVVNRHDSQSRDAALLLDRLLQEHCGVKFFSPIAAFSEHVILRHLLTDKPEAWEHIASCVWGRWCGQCQKCLRYALAEACIGGRLIPFDVPPLNDGNPALRALLAGLDRVGTPFRDSQLHSLLELFDSGALRGLPATAAQLAERARNEHDRFRVADALASVIPDDLAPSGFSWSFTASTPNPHHQR
jgi:7-cyano-7-deazaguanine synthase in queuosine biosynthesis